MKLFDEIENRKLNGEKRIKWREIRQARCALLAPPALLPLFSTCESVAVLRQAMRVCLLACTAFGRGTAGGASQHGLRPHCGFRLQLRW
jgi:hypothetical protein